MGKILINKGNGIIVDSSENVSIIQNGNENFDELLEEQLQQLLVAYKNSYPKDVQGIHDLEKAYVFVVKNPGKSTDDVLSCLKGDMLKLAKKLSLKVLVKALSKAFGVHS